MHRQLLSIVYLAGAWPQAEIARKSVRHGDRVLGKVREFMDDTCGLVPI